MKFALKSVALATALFSSAAMAAFPNDCSVTDTFAAATSCAGTYTNNGGNNLGAGNTAIADLTAAFGDLGWFLSTAEMSFDDNALTIDLGGTFNGPFAIALKAGSAQSGGGYNLYYFENQTAISSLSYTSGPSGKDLSHASFYGAELVPGPIPEPETYALMLAGLGLVGFMARRRKQA